MGSKIVWRVLVIPVVLVLLASVVAMYGFSLRDVGNTIDRGGNEGIISLIPPPFFGIAGASEPKAVSGGAFPTEEAGIAAYVNVGHEIDIKSNFVNLTNIYNEEPWQLEFDDTHILGTVSIQNFGGDVHPRLYLDVNGWIVAYFNKTEPASMIMQWTGTDSNNPQITEINTTTLEDAIEDACNAVGIEYNEVKSNINYYDFEFPYADSLMLFVNSISYPGSNSAHICIPLDALYEASYSHYVYNTGSIWVGGSNAGYRSCYCISNLNIDGSPIHTFDAGRDMRVFYAPYDTENALSLGKLHSIEIVYSVGYCDLGSAGVATVLIYRST